MPTAMHFSSSRRCGTARSAASWVSPSRRSGAALDIRWSTAMTASSTSVEDAVMAVLQRMSKAAPDLREGLTQEAADRAVPHLRELLKCIAVGITDHEGTMLSWDGEANEHYEGLAPYIDKAMNGIKREY